MEAPPDITATGTPPAGPPPVASRPSDVLAGQPVSPTAGPPPTPRPAAGGSSPAPPVAGTPDEAPDSTDVRDSRLIRPYAMTGGRTVSSADISLESQVQTSTRLNRDDTTYRWEAAKILKLAERPMALVEIAARAEIPIGVARVVISDLVDAGAVHVQRNAPVTSYTSLLEKVLDGIRDL